MPSVFVVQLDLELKEKLRQGLISQGFELATPPHTIFQGKKKGVTCTLYNSGKLTVQGKEMAPFIEFFLEPEILHSFSFQYDYATKDFSPHIGVDESGKGDFFGALCIAGVYADSEQIKELLKIGVKDSKQLSDGAIVKIAAKIQSVSLSHVVRIGPKRYNELYAQFRNLNLLLAWGHATVIDQLVDKTGCKTIIIDQFAAENVVEDALKKKKKEVLLTQKIKGEEDVVVAAASILARASFLDSLKGLKEKWHIDFPKGANQQILKIGKQFVETNGPLALAEVGKMHFKTANEILATIVD